MRAAERPLSAGLLVTTAACCLGLALVGAADGLPFLVPALLLSLPLARGVYVGERTLVGAVARHRRPRRSPTRFLPTRAAERLALRGTRLIAASLAKRPPPLPARAT